MVVAQTAPPSMRIGWSSVHPILEPVLSGVWKLGVPPNSWHVTVGNYGEPLDFGVSHFQVPIFQIKLDVCVCIYIYILADIHTYVCIYICIHIYIHVYMNRYKHMYTYIYMCVLHIYSSNIPMSHPFLFALGKHDSSRPTLGTSSDALGGARPPGGLISWWFHGDFMVISWFN